MVARDCLGVCASCGQAALRVTTPLCRTLSQTLTSRPNGVQVQHEVRILQTVEPRQINNYSYNGRPPFTFGGNPASQFGYNYTQAPPPPPMHPQRVPITWPPSNMAVPQYPHSYVQTAPRGPPINLSHKLYQQPAAKVPMSQSSRSFAPLAISNGCTARTGSNMPSFGQPRNPTNTPIGCDNEHSQPTSDGIQRICSENMLFTPATGAVITSLNGASSTNQPAHGASRLLKLAPGDVPVRLPASSLGTTGSAVARSGARSTIPKTDSHNALLKGSSDTAASTGIRVSSPKLDQELSSNTVTMEVTLNSTAAVLRLRQLELKQTDSLYRALSRLHIIRSLILCKYTHYVEGRPL